jgi:hypothetical protein
VLSVGLLLGQQRAGVLHPVALPFTLLLTITLLSALVGTAAGLGRTVRGPRRRSAAAWGLFCCLPLAFWAGLAAYTLRLAAAGQAFPRNIFSDIVGMGAASLLEGEAQRAYPRRLESGRLVMF